MATDFHSPALRNLLLNRIIVAAFMLSAWFSLSAAALAADAKPNTLTAQELADGWISLFDGESLYGWEPATKADWQVKDGAIVVTGGEPGLLCTTSEFADYVLRCDFKAPANTNSGIFLRTPAKPKDPASDCYELNIATPEVSPWPTGSLVERAKAKPQPSQTTSDDAWHTLEVTADAGRFIVKLDGEAVLDYTDAKPIKRGLIGLQLNKGRAEFKNIKLKPLGTRSIFNGKDLSGWKVFPGEGKDKSIYSVTPAGELNVKNGPGSLESEGQYADFVLQLEVFSNGKHLNSGVFFRSIPGEFTNGYECQIQNGYKDADRTKPLDFGTGAFYRRQPARKVNADDFVWFPMTLVVSGSHMATWVNGVQVSDWTDTRAADSNPRKGLRTEAGTLSIQGHDPTTDLSFRKLQIVELPSR